jgi:hypothetical protein
VTKKDFSMTHAKDYFSRLPCELQLCILGYLEHPQDMVRLSYVSRHFYHLSYDKFLWKKFLKKGYHAVYHSEGEIIHPRQLFAYSFYTIQLKYFPLHPVINRINNLFLQLVALYKADAAPHLLSAAKQSSANAQIIFSYQGLYTLLLKKDSFVSANHLIEIILLYPESAMLLLKNVELYAFIQKHKLLTIDLLKHLAVAHAEVGRLILTDQKFYTLFLSHSAGIPYLKMIGRSSSQAALEILNKAILYQPILLEKDAASWLYDVARFYSAAAILILDNQIFYNTLLHSKEAPFFLNTLALVHRDNAILILKNPVFYGILLSHHGCIKVLYNLAKTYLEAAQIILSSEIFQKILLSNFQYAARYLLGIARSHKQAAVTILEEKPLYDRLCDGGYRLENLYKLAEKYKIKYELLNKQEMRFDLLNALKEPPYSYGKRCIP